MNIEPKTNPIGKDLVLIGGGHTHAIALKLWGMQPIPGVRLTLITDTSHTPYSGMLPGHVAGFYSYDETHIDLRRLAGFAQAQLYLDRAIGLDLEKNQVLCREHPPVSFDYLSLDIGSTPAKSSVPGAEKYAIAAKPVPEFLQVWSEIITEAQNNPQQSLSIGIVGGGAGGVELALNMYSRLAAIFPVDRLNIHLFHRSDRVLLGHNPWVSKTLQRILRERGIKLHLSEKVVEVLPEQIICASGLTVKCNYIFWVTQASAPSWIQDSGLATDTRGFVLVKDTLQSVSHPHIFAAGDIATMENYPRPKAGVFAVRQGQPLWENLRRILQNRPLKPYQPQKQYLSLIGTGDGSAIASWWRFGWRSSLLWRWKDYIDRQFMDRFSNLPSSMTEQQSQGDRQPIMYCAGCGAKVGSSILQRVLARIAIPESPDILIGLDRPDDAAIVQVPANKLIVHTIDYFPSLINDPFVFAQIATNHCLSDLFAMGATPQTALAVATIPHGREDKIEETLYQLISGANQVLAKCQTVLVGGHTTEGAELGFGLACNGWINPEQILTKSGMRPGDLLILTKAIGTGTLFAADMRYQAKGRWIDGAVQSMLLSNQLAAQILQENGATACTDITGFGLIGHLLEMLKASQVSVELDLATLPILEGARETIEMGITSSLYPQNLQAASYIDNSDKFRNVSNYALLFDPQTSGGLLAALPPEKARSCLQQLKDVGYSDSSPIGRVVAALGEKLTIKIGLPT